MMSIDRIERLASLFMAALGVLFSLYILYVVVDQGQERSVYTAAYSKTKGCPSGYTYDKLSDICQRIEITRSGALWLEFALIGGCSIFLAFFAFRQRRTGVVFFSIFMGLVLGIGSIGVPYFALGIWLLWRAWRLQRYGDATFAGSSRRAREEAMAKKEGKILPAPAIATPGPTAVETAGPRPSPEASKRFTPKKKTGKRR